MSFLKGAALLLALVLGLLVAADLVGVFLSFCLDISISRNVSKGMYFAIWFVDGVFCGLITYFLGGNLVAPPTPANDWTTAANSKRIGLAVLGAVTLIDTLLCVAFYKIWWSRGINSESYVPDNMALTITFFVGHVTAMVLGHRYGKISLNVSTRGVSKQEERKRKVR